MFRLKTRYINIDWWVIHYHIRIEIMKTFIHIDKMWWWWHTIVVIVRSMLCSMGFFFMSIARPNLFIRNGNRWVSGRGTVNWIQCFVDTDKTDMAFLIRYGIGMAFEHAVSNWHRLDRCLATFQLNPPPSARRTFLPHETTTNILSDIKSMSVWYLYSII